LGISDPLELMTKLTEHGFCFSIKKSAICSPLPGSVRQPEQQMVSLGADVTVRASSLSCHVGGRQEKAFNRYADRFLAFNNSGTKPNPKMRIALAKEFPLLVNRMIMAGHSFFST
jgi:hypothetical protein